MRAINPDQLRALVEVVDRGSFSAAARALHLTQPAVSLQIRELEKRFNLRLIERLGKQAHPTPPGRALVARARIMLAENDRANDAMRRFQKGWLGRVQISATYTALTYSIPGVLKRLKTEYPTIEVVVTSMTTRDTVEAVIDNRIDLGLVTLPVAEPRLRVTPLRWETLVAIFAADTPDVPDIVTPEHIAAGPLVLEHPRGAIYELVTGWASEHGVTIRPAMHVGAVEAIKTVVASGIGISLVPDVAVTPPPPDLIVRPVAPALPCTLGLVEHASKPAEPAFRIVRDMLVEEIGEPRRDAVTDPGERTRRRLSRSPR